VIARAVTLLKKADFMMNLKKLSSSLLIASTLAVATPAPQANAGIIFAPVAVGIAVLVVGIIYRDTLLIVLDADGNLSQSSLEANLAKKYSFIDDRDVIHGLASAIREKAITAPVIDGKKTVSLSKDEVLNLIAPTGLADLQPAAVEALVQDLE